MRSIELTACQLFIFLKCHIVQNFYNYELFMVIRVDVVASLMYLCSSNLAKPKEEEDTDGYDDTVLNSSKLSSTTECLNLVVVIFTVIACLSRHDQSTNQKKQITTIDAVHLKEVHVNK